MMNYSITGHRRRVETTVKRTLAPQKLERIKSLFKKFDTIPLNNFHQLYEDSYNESIDAYALGFDNGILGLLEETRLIQLEETEYGYNCYLKQGEERVLNPIKENTNNECIRKKSHWLFDPNSVLWIIDRYGINELLMKPKDEIIIASSPLELSLKRHPNMAYKEIRRIQEFMCHFKDGIGLTQIHVKLNIKLRLFEANSLNTMVYDYPELFYVVEPEEMGDDKRIYDGRIKTAQDLVGLKFRPHLENSYYLKYIALSIQSGLYQKTLILIKAAGPQGLKLASWIESLKNNFPVTSKFEEEVIEKSPLFVMRLWASMELINLRSPETCKNDLRIMLPSEKIDFDKFLPALSEKVKAAIEEDKAESLRYIREYAPINDELSQAIKVQ